MKTTATTVIANRNAENYFLLLNPIQAKKVLWVMTSLKGDQRLSESKVPEVHHIARFYDGVIQSEFAKQLAKNLAAKYAEKHPGILLTKKMAEAYTEVNHGKLLAALGVHGFDYVITVLRNGKKHVSAPENGISEKHMLKAMRWEEERENQDKEKSNAFHRRKGLALVGFNDMADELVQYSFVIANVYEQVSPEDAKVISTVQAEEAEERTETKEMTNRQMKIHFIERAELIEEFYSTEKPTVPVGFPEEELVEGSMLYSLAEKDMFKDSNKVIEYVRKNNAYTAMYQKLQEEFSAEEVEKILQKMDIIKELIRSEL